MNHKTYVMRGVEISFDTACVGSIEILEESFGFLWGHGKPINEITEDEEYFRSIWDEVRKAIFGKSAKAKKIALKKLEDCIIKRELNKHENFR